MMKYLNDFLSDILCFERAKESLKRPCDEVKALSTGWKKLKLPFNI